MAELKIAPLRPEAGRNAPARNEACALDLGWVRDVRVNLSAAERRVATLARPPHGQEGRAGRLAAEGRHLHRPHHAQRRRHRRPRAPAVRQGASRRSAPTSSKRSAWPTGRITTGAVCVYHRFVKTAVEALEGSGIPVAAVSTGFPAGLVPHDVKLQGDRGLGARRRQGDRHRHHPRACADRQLAGALRRDARLPRRPAAMRM